MTKQQLIETIRRVIKQEIKENTQNKTIPVSDRIGKYRIVSLDGKRVLDDRFFDTEEEAKEASRKYTQGAKIIKLKEAGPATAPSKPKEKPDVAEPPVKSPGKKEPRRPLGNPEVKPKPKATMTEAEMLAKIVKRFKAAKKNG